MMRLAVLAAATAAAAAADWTLTAQNVGQGIYGIGFFDPLNGVITNTDGLGYNILRTADGGKTFANVPNGDLYLPQLNSPAAYGTFAVVSGDSNIQFSWNSGFNFSTAIGSNNAGGVTVRLVDPASPAAFAIIGQTQDGATNGVVTSTNGGLTWKAFDASAAAGGNGCAYGAFPTQANWFLTALTEPAPSNNDDPTTTTGTPTTSTGGTTTAADGKDGKAAGIRRLPGQRLRAARQADGSIRMTSTPLRDAGYSGAILASSTAGANWTNVFTLNGTAPLAIDCLDAQNCAFTAQDSQFAYIFTTNDGGNTWAQTLSWNTTAGAILTDIKVSGAGSYWAAGGVATQTSYTPAWFESSDSGKTWTQFQSALTEQPLVVTGLECLASAAGAPCWSTLIDPNGSGYIAQFQ